MKKNPNVFLSHSSKDKFFARKLAEQLTGHGAKVWIDGAELRIGDSLIEKIGKAIESADFIAVVLSHDSVRSNWVQKELHMAMTRVLAERNIKILPLLKDRCEVPAFLRDLVWADFTEPDNFDAALFRVLKSLGISTATAVTSSPKAVPQAPSKEEGTLEQFEDIAILEVDKSRTYRPDDTKALYNVYLRLSAYPPQEWAEIFDAERNFPRHSMWREAWLEGDYVVVYCIPEEVKQYHLADLKQDVASSNKKYREFLVAQAKKLAWDKRREEIERKNLDDALGGLEL
jgi:hypothetical protein